MNKITNEVRCTVVKTSPGSETGKFIARTYIVRQSRSLSCANNLCTAEICIPSRNLYTVVIFFFFLINLFFFFTEFFPRFRFARHFFPRDAKNISTKTSFLKVEEFPICCVLNSHRAIIILHLICFCTCLFPPASTPISRRTSNVLVRVRVSLL